MRVEITLNTGVTVAGHVTSFKLNTDFTGAPTGFTWKYRGAIDQGHLGYLRPEAVDAIVVYPEAGDPGYSVEMGGGQDERDGEAAESGGDELHLVGDVEDRDREQDSGS